MPAKMTVRAVSFDGDDTLWDFDIVLRRALDVVLEELRRRHPGPATAALTVDEMISIRARVARHHTGDWSRLEDIRRAAFAATLEYIGSPDDTTADDLNQMYLQHRFTDTDLFPDVLPCLQHLHPDHPLGLISNGNSYPADRGLELYLSFTVFAADHGVAKPDPGLFVEASRLVGCYPTEIVHVGDGASDVYGARRAGCRTVLVHRGGPRPAHAHDADAVIPDLQTLPALLEAWT